jgi:hypothetical protein
MFNLYCSKSLAKSRFNSIYKDGKETLLDYHQDLIDNDMLYQNYQEDASAWIVAQSHKPIGL